MILLFITISIVIWVFILYSVWLPRNWRKIWGVNHSGFLIYMLINDFECQEKIHLPQPGLVCWGSITLFFSTLLGFAPWICIATPNMYTHRHDCMCICYWVGACVIGCEFWLIRTKVWVSLFYLTNGLGRLAIILSFISIIIWVFSYTLILWLPRKWRNIGGIIHSLFLRDIYIYIYVCITQGGNDFG